MSGSRSSSLAAPAYSGVALLAAVLLCQTLSATQWLGGALLLLSIWGLGKRLGRPPHG